jgi:23S rRNA (adenine2503-C2)-methyltransferase
MHVWNSDAPEIAPDANAQLYGNVAGMGLGSIKHMFQRLGEAPYRAMQVFEGIYKHQWLSWSEFSNLPKSLRARLGQDVIINWPEMEQSKFSIDGSAKHTLKLIDGNFVECVYIPYENRATVCISSQVGCAMGCTFCATGAMGIIRNLTAAEIVGQVMALVLYHKHQKGLPLNIVLMGMGEPLHNLSHVMGAFGVLSHPNGLAVPAKRVTISTSGLVPGMMRLAGHHPRPRLALSLNATTDEARSEIMPINTVWGLEQLAETLSTFPLESGELITLEYVLIKGCSDSMEDAARLSGFAGRFPSKINLIPYNPCPGQGQSPPDEGRLNEIAAYLAEKGHVVSVRRSRGQDVGGACGQLTQCSCN